MTVRFSGCVALQVTNSRGRLTVRDASTVFARGGDAYNCCDDWRGGRVEMQPSRKR